ncbi:cell wall-binding repeat-containing protein [Clostridium sp. A1-XYC3]|uniref:Cell wall-binding repeat-containing protein n=1 Tax=Clostridium tanneri TaxID=3037988 RepID=A0ABU4JQA7_9CLOT|nr:cell wall-binding repeat-containing protein [Clostridium sp. A1-XYC3]MDW8800320.1 cell wall-binding repeat-containing protein [Clostridium sp. A1-XYC3]
MKKLFRLLLIFMMTISLSFSNLLLVHAENGNNSTELNFTPTQVIADPDKPILYFTDMAGKKVHSINYDTGEHKSISFTLAPERLTLSKGELFVTLLKSGHQQFGDSPEEASIAIIDAGSLTLREEFNVDIDPSDIVVDKQGYIYLFGGSHQWTYIKAYSRDGKEVSSSEEKIYQGSAGQLHPTMDKVYFMETKSSPIQMGTFNASNGSSKISFYKWLYHDDFPANNYFKISPDGKYIFNSAGTVFNAANDKGNDMTYVTAIKGEFKDIAFDTAANKFYTASSENIISVYDYSNFKLLGKYKTPSNIQNIFAQDNKIITVTKDNAGKYTINTIFKQNILDALSLDNPSEGTIPDKIISAVYDSSRNKVYSVDSAFNKLLIFDAATDALERTVDLKYRPSAITLSEDGTKLYIVNDDTQYLVSKIDLSTLANIGNLKFATAPKADLVNGHRHIYEKGNKLYVITGDASPALLVFDSDTFVQINYGAPIDQVGDIKFTADGKYFYKLNEYSFPSGFEANNVMKYSVNGNSIKLEESSKIEHLASNNYPIDTPVFLTENENKVIGSDKLFNAKDLTKAPVALPEPIYAVYEKENIMVGKSGVYSLSSMKLINTIPTHEKNILIFDNFGKLHYFDNITMKSINAKPDIKKLTVQNSSISNGDVDVPPDYPIVVKFDYDIETVDSSKITIKDSGKNYEVNAYVQDGLLVIEHEDLSYNTNFTLNIDSKAVNDSVNTLYNDSYSISFNTGKEFNRIKGIDRYETSVNVSKQWASSHYLVLASGEDFPDALSAAPLARTYGAPILLTNPSALMPSTEAEISRLGVKEVFIIGGTASVSKNIENKLAAKGISITRLSGNDRYETSLAVADYIGSAGEIFVVSGANFPDALSIASYAADSQIPILLTEGSKLSEGIEEFISVYGVNKTYLIGGTGVINEDVANKLPNVERIGGRDRYETNIKVMERFPFYFGITMIASGQGFADALSGSALAATFGSPIILMDEGMANNGDIIHRLGSLKSYIKMKYVIGGEAVVPPSVVDKVFK